MSSAAHRGRLTGALDALLTTPEPVNTLSISIERVAAVLALSMETVRLGRPESRPLRWPEGSRVKFLADAPSRRGVVQEIMRRVGERTALAGRRWERQ